MCVLCDYKMNGSEIKVAQRIANYAKDRGNERYMKLFKRIEEQAEKRKGGKGEGEHLPPIEEKGIEAKEETDEETVILPELPTVCFKCIYDLILVYEGRQNALRVFNVARNELESGRYNHRGKSSANVAKKLHQDSLELKGEFNEYYNGGNY